MENRFRAAPEFAVTGNGRIVITARCEILLYSPEEMRVRCGGLTACVYGDGLELETLDGAEISIRGTIFSVEFLTEGGR